MAEKIKRLAIQRNPIALKVSVIFFWYKKVNATAVKYTLQRAKISIPLCRHLIFASLAVCTLASPFIFSAAYSGKWVANYAPQTFAERGAGAVREWIYYV